MYNNFKQHFNSTSRTKQFAKSLRRPLTPAENRFWFYVKGRKLFGFKFRRQHPVGNFIADFYCHELKLVVEIDGNIHSLNTQKIRDFERDLRMKELGLNVLRFSNEDVFFNAQIIVEEVKKIIDKKQPHLASL
jgi:very-short-patch-repair endonuclease